MRGKAGIAAGMLLAALSVQALAQGAPQPASMTLDQMVADLQKSPGDRILRERIIALAQTLPAPPPIPAEAKRNLVKGATFHREAKDSGDMDLAVRAYEQALLLAPWWPEAYYNAALALVSAGRYDEAIQDLEFYLLTMPKPADAEEAQNQIYAIEAKRELAARESAGKARQVQAEATAQAERAALDSFEGRWEVTRYERAQGTGESPVGAVVTITRRDDAFDASGPSDFFSSVWLHQSGRTLSGTWTPGADALVGLFATLPAQVVRQAAGDITYHPVMVLSGDGMTIEAEVDNYSIKGMQTTQFLMTRYQYTGVERYAGFFKYTLRRLSTASPPPAGAPGTSAVSSTAAPAGAAPPASGDLQIKR